MADSIIGSLTYDIKANSLPLDAGLLEAKAKVEGFGASTGSIVAKAGAGLVAAGLAVAGVAVDMAAKFQTSTAQLAVNAGISTAAANAIGDAFLGTALKSEFSAEKLMTAYAPVAGQLASVKGSALSTSESLQFMTAAADLASASGQDLNATTQDLAKVMQTFALPVSQAASVTDTLLNSSNAAGVSLDAWTAAVARAGAMAGAAKPSVQDLSTFLLDLQNHGETGRAAMGLLGSTLNGLMTPTQAVIDEQKKLGLSFIDAKGQLDPLSQIIAQVAPKIQGMGDAQATATLKALGFGAASDKLVQTIQGGTGDWDKYAAEVNKVGTVQQGVTDKSHDMGYQFSVLTAAIGDAAIKFGQFLAPAIATVTGWLADNLPKAIQAVSGWWQAHQAVILQVAGTIAGFVSGVAQQLIHILSDIVNWVSQNRQVFVTVAQVLTGVLAGAITVVVGALRFLADHLDAVIPILAAAATAFIIFKAAMLVQDIIQGVSIALFMFQAGLEGATVAEVGASTASYALGAAIDTMLGPIGWVTIAISLLVAGFVSIFESSQKAQDDLNKWNEAVSKWKTDQTNALNDVARGWQELQQKTVNAKDVIATLINNLEMMKGGAFNAAAGLTQADLATASWIGGLDQGNLKIVSLLATLPNGISLVEQFHTQLGLAGGDGGKALDNMANSGKSTSVEIRNVKLAIDALKTGSDLAAAQSAFSELMSETGGNAEQALAKLQALNPEYATLITQNNALAGALGVSGQGMNSLNEVTFGGVKGNAAELITKINDMAKETGLTSDQVVSFANEAGGQIIHLANGAVVTLTGNMSQWQAEIDAANAKLQAYQGTLGAVGQTVVKINFSSNIEEVIAGAESKLQGLGTGTATRSAEGRKVTQPMMSLIGEGGETEWVIPRHKAGPFAPLLDAMLGVGSSLSASLGTISPPATTAAKVPSVTNIITAAPTASEASPVTVQLNMSGVMTRSRAELRGVAMDMLDAVNEGLKSKGMAPLPIRQVPL